MKNLFDNQEGFTFVLVIIVIAVVGVLVTSYISSAIFNINFTEKQADMSRAYFAAQSGIENLRGNISNKISEINNNNIEEGSTIYNNEFLDYEQDDASYNVKFIKLDGVKYSFQSLGKYNRSEKKINLAIDLAGGLKGVNVNDPNGEGNELIDLTAGGIEDDISVADLRDVIDFRFEAADKNPEELFYKMVSNFHEEVFTEGDEKSVNGNDYNLYNVFYDSNNDYDDSYATHDYSDVDFNNDVVFIDGSWKFTGANINNSIVFVKNNVHFTGNTNLNNSILIIFDSEGSDNSQGNAKTNLNTAFKASGPPSYTFEPNAFILQELYENVEKNPPLNNSIIWYVSK